MFCETPCALLNIVLLEWSRIVYPYRDHNACKHTTILHAKPYGELNKMPAARTHPSRNTHGFDVPTHYGRSMCHTLRRIKRLSRTWRMEQLKKQHRAQEALSNVCVDTSECGNQFIIIANNMCYGEYVCARTNGLHRHEKAHVYFLLRWLALCIPFMLLLRKRNFSINTLHSKSNSHALRTVCVTHSRKILRMHQRRLFRSTVKCSGRTFHVEPKTRRHII